MLGAFGLTLRWQSGRRRTSVYAVSRVSLADCKVGDIFLFDGRRWRVHGIQREGSSLVIDLGK